MSIDDPKTTEGRDCEARQFGVPVLHGMLLRGTLAQHREDLDALGERELYLGLGMGSVTLPRL